MSRLLFSAVKWEDNIKNWEKLVPKYDKNTGIKLRFNLINTSNL